ncbi:unnamed protein product, partial [Discosporangium mesarthrocarpum]
MGKTDPSSEPYNEVDRPSKTSKKKRSRGPKNLASKFDKFDKDRKYDPFMDQDPIMRDMKEGMEALVSMCNGVELNSLCGALGVTGGCSNPRRMCQVMAYIREGGRQADKRYGEVLKLFWEGLLYEYLRSVGCPLRNAEHDPRHYVMRYWRRSLLDPNVRAGFVPFYLERKV